MAIIKCKMCGGDIEFTPGEAYGTCAYCGSTSTIPQGDDEGRLNLFNRANHFRRQGEFDKALAAYEKLLEQDDTDAEAHWCAVISRYGIEYVEDPATRKRIPTCHRLQLTSILADADYKAAVQYAPDSESRRLYEEEAARIAEIQRGILAISQNEKPYDVFICYKETDEAGQRTHDSQWAQEVYYGLTEQGYKVFFSRITLEDKLGQEYEPYIFAALNSARVMIVIGSKPEYFNAVWVKNEWSRYLALMARDRKRLLIPCYRGMDPYDLPDELSNLQSQDMSKIGFMQDLLRGVRKVLEAEKKPMQAAPVQPAAAAPEASEIKPGVSSLMERAALFLEDGDFDSAAQYLERVLDLDPKYAPAYAAKVCVAFRLRKEEDLAEMTFMYEDNLDWKKALRFATPQQKAVYDGYITRVKQRVEQQIRDFAYDCAVEMAVSPYADRDVLDAELAAYKVSCTCSTGKRADGSRRPGYQTKETRFLQALASNEIGNLSESGLLTAAAMFMSIGDSEASECARQCEKLVEQARQNAIYQDALQKMNAFLHTYNLELFIQSTDLFLSISEYKDAKVKAKECTDKAEEIRAVLYDEALQKMQTAGNRSIKWKRAILLLSDSWLDDYRDVEQLREHATEMYEQCLAEDREKKQREEEKRKEEERKLEEIRQEEAKRKEEEKRQAEEMQRRKAEVAAQKRRKDILVASLIAMIVIAVFFAGKLVFDRIKSFQYSPGKYVTFGHYPHTRDGADNTSIEWLVLTRERDKVLLISRYGLDAQPYNKEYTSITWEECTLYTWLNDTFLNKAFTAEEQAAIIPFSLTSSVQNSSGGNNNQNKVFLLSSDESNKYFGVTNENTHNTESRIVPTAYAIKQGAYTSSSNMTSDGSAAGWWWLRSSGRDLYNAARVLDVGSLSDSTVSNAGGCVRPAIWLDLSSGIF